MNGELVMLTCQNLDILMPEVAYVYFSQVLSKSTTQSNIEEKYGRHNNLSKNMGLMWG